MNTKKSFKVSKKEIIQFCKLTKDKNPIHLHAPKKFYKGKFKKALVPGLLLITKVNQILSKRYKGALIIDILANFKQPLTQNELSNYGKSHFNIKIMFDQYFSLYEN